MSPPDPAPAAARRATRLVFLAAGIGTAVWAALIPFARLRTGLDDRQLGLLLLALAAGSVLSMPVAGALVPRLGCRRVIAAGLLLATALLPALATLSAVPALFAALAAFGAGFGALDVSMNMQAILVERASGRAIMSGLHAMYSLGGLLGAAAMAALLGLGTPPLLATAALTATLLALLLAALPSLLPGGGTRTGPAIALPRGIVLLLGTMCAAAFLAEGAVFDWGGVFLSTAHGLLPAYGGLAYAAFSITMTAGRFTGDRAVRRLGPARLVMASALLTAAGFAAATLLPGWPLSLLGFAAVGAGCANLVPVLFSAVGRQTRMPESLALPAVTSMGYAGMLAGPSGIGFLAKALTLPTALLLVGALLLLVAAASPRLAPGRS